MVAFGETVVNGGSKGDHLDAGNGTSIVLTGIANGNIMVANDGRYANGNFVKLDGGQATGNNQFWAGSGNPTLIGGTGQDSLVAGSGNVTMSGGGGQANDFLFFNQSATPAVRSSSPISGFRQRYFAKSALSSGQIIAAPG